MTRCCQSDSKGAVSRGDIYEAVGAVGTNPEERDWRTLVSMQHVNSETGAILQVAQAGKILANFDVVTLCDCSQSAGKLALPQADMAIVSAHKSGGPIGIGALLVRDYGLLHPGGGHERRIPAGDRKSSGSDDGRSDGDAGGAVLQLPHRGSRAKRSPAARD